MCAFEHAHSLAPSLSKAKAKTAAKPKKPKKGPQVKGKSKAVLAAIKVLDEGPNDAKVAAAESLANIVRSEEQEDVALAKARGHLR